MSLVPEISAAWGTSRAYVYKLAKGGGPLDSVESATAWRTANAKMGIGYRSLQVEHQVSEGGQGRVENFSNAGVGERTGKKRKIRLKSVEASLKNAIGVEEQAVEAVQRCEEESRADPGVLNLI